MTFIKNSSSEPQNFRLLVNKLLTLKFPTEVPPKNRFFKFSNRLFQNA